MYELIRCIYEKIYNEYYLKNDVHCDGDCDNCPSIGMDGSCPLMREDNE